MRNETSFLLASSKIPKVQAKMQEEKSLLNKVSFVRDYWKSATANDASASNATPSRPSGTVDLEGNPSSNVFDYVKKSVGDGVARASTTTRNVVSGVKQQTEEASFFINSPRLPIFLFFAGMGGIFIFLAFVFLPMIVFAPQKFSLLMTVGSICLIASLATIKGPIPLVKHMIERRRIPFSCAYVASLAITLYASLIVKSYILTLLSAAVQILTLVFFLISYLPGGKRFLGFIQDSVLRAAGFGKSTSTLPI